MGQRLAGSRSERDRNRVPGCWGDGRIVAGLHHGQDSHPAAGAGGRWGRGQLVQLEPQEVAGEAGRAGPAQEEAICSVF